MKLPTYYFLTASLFLIFTWVIFGKLLDMTEYTPIFIIFGIINAGVITHLKPTHGLLDLMIAKSLENPTNEKTYVKAILCFLVVFTSIVLFNNYF